MPEIYNHLEIGQILLMLLLVAISSWAAHPTLQSHGGVLLMKGVPLLQKETERQTKGKGELGGVFLFPLSWEVHSKSVADLGLE